MTVHTFRDICTADCDNPEKYTDGTSDEKITPSHKLELIWNDSTSY